MTAEPLSEQLGGQIAALRFDDLPPETVAMARKGFIDTIGVMLAGSHEPVIARLIAAQGGSTGPVRLLFGDRKASAEEAALIGGTAAHILDYDDVSLRCHISAVIVPAILAEAEQLNRSGRDMIASYVAGYETMADLVEREPGVHNVGGWHTTGTHGAIAAAAAAAHLNRLDAHQTAQALCAAASLASGIMANFGSMMKSVHAGLAAKNGLTAVRLVRAGIDATPDALDHPQGFLRAVSPEGRADRTRPAHDFLTNPRLLRVGLNIKRYPLCYCTHRVIDALLALRATTALQPEDIETVEVHISEDWAAILRNAQPQTALAAKFSAQFAAAAAIIAGNVGLAQLTDGFVQRADVQDLIGRVRVVINRNYDDVLVGASVSDSAVVILKDGTRLATPQVARAKGHADDPIDQAALMTKFADCLTHGGHDALIRPFTDAFSRLEDLPARGILAPQLAGLQD